MAATRTAATEARRLQKTLFGNQRKTIKEVETRLRSRRSTIAALAKELDGDIKRIETMRRELDKAMKSLEATDRMGNFEIQK
jgi:peptidoglycan hydrolase CwlO-like protein